MNNWIKLSFKPDEIIHINGDVYLKRWFIIKTKFFGIYLHNLLRSDRDRELHDHPWPNISIILKGVL